MKTKVRIIIAEKHTLIRKSISSLLTRDGLFEVAGEASDMDELIQILKSTQTDVILFDLQMLLPNEHQSAIHTLKNLSPKIKVIQWSMNPEVKTGNKTINNGSGIYLTSDCDETILFNSIYSLNEDESGEDVIPKYVAPGTEKNKKSKKKEQQFEMSERQIQILIQICMGKNNQEIADALFLTPANVDSHKAKIYRKTKCNNAVNLLRYALTHGIVRV